MENANEFPDFYQGNKCIWMEADVVAYKLCDQNYDCERCPFDFVMRNTWREKTESDRIMLNFANNNVIDKVIGKISRIVYDGKRIYFQSDINGNWDIASINVDGEDLKSDSDTVEKIIKKLKDKN